MLRALNISATGMASQEANVSTISNNLANVNTVGYKQERTEFEDLLYETVNEAGARSSSNSQYNVGTQIGSGSKVSATRRTHQQGTPQVTQNPFDVMINGDGFLGIITPNNEVKYTRDGAFNPDSQGFLVSRNGDKLFPGIQIPSNTMKVNISQDGSVEAFLPGQLEPQVVGQIPVFTFTNDAGLKKEGANLYSASVASGEPLQNIAGQNNAGAINQGMLENSNVNVMNEMTNLIKAQRAYEMNSKVMGIADQMLQTVNNIR
jgi:flagellar basal-body rod protein FlgG